MTNLNKFRIRLSSDKALQKRMSEASTIKDVVKIAKSVGCDLTEHEVKDDMMKAISGGEGDTPVFSATGAVASSPNANTVGPGSIGVSTSIGSASLIVADISKYTAEVVQNATGEGNTLNNVGSNYIHRTNSI